MTVLGGTLTVERVATLGGSIVLVVAKVHGRQTGVQYVELTVPDADAPAVGEEIHVTVERRPG
jgi:hypothetical protein